MTVNKQPHHGYKTDAIRTNLGRVLEPAPQATTDPRPTPTVVFVCKRRLHVSTLASVLCHRCSAEGDRSQPPVMMEKFERAKA